MTNKSLPSFGEKSTKFSLFIFFGLLIFSAAFFVFANDNKSSTMTIFQDSDQDGLSNEEEKLYGTDPNNPDTDGDGYSDGVEVMSGYDPLKPAPGDKIIKEPSTSSPVAKATTQDGSLNITEQASNEIASILKNTNKTGEAVSMDDINISVDKVLNSTSQDVVLPEIDTKDIKIKSLAKNLTGKKKTEQEKKDVLEYLTVVSYTVANNSPHSFTNEGEFGSVMLSLVNQSMSGLVGGNMQQLDTLSTTGEKMLGELKDVEVPEAMLDTHIKAMKMATYMIQLKEEVKKDNTSNDPLGQIASLSKIQGLLSVVSDFSLGLNQKLKDYGIDGIPISL